MRTNKNERGFTPRRVTICEKFFARETSAGITVPELRLTGKWLGETVFGVGMRVEVNYVDEKLVISLAKEQPEWVEENQKEKGSSRVRGQPVKLE